MDDKTAAIPSLKDFKDKKNTDKKSQRTKSEEKRATSQKSKAVSQDTMRIDNIKSTSRNTSKTGDKQKSKPAGNTTRKPASAPSSYERDRVKNSSSQKNAVKRTRSDYDSSRRVERDAQAQRRAQAAQKPVSRKSAVSSYYDDIEPVRKAPVNREVNQSAKTPRTPYVSKSVRAQNKTLKKIQSKPSGRPTATRPALKKAKKPLTEARRKFRNVMICVSMILVLLIVFGVLSLTVFFKTKSFEVSGIDMYTKQQIVNASGLSEGDNIFTARKKDAENRIKNICPYVESADVYAIFPDSIGIDITMAKPACKINAIGGVYIISDKGKVLEVTSSADEVDVPLVEGVQIKGRAEGEFVDYGSELLEDTLTEMFKAFSDMGSKKITQINISAKGEIFEIRYIYDNRIVVYLGIPEEITYKMQAADVIIREKIEVEGASAISGELDVSTCHETTKSYFNQYSIITPDVAPQISTTAPVEEYTEVYEY